MITLYHAGNAVCSIKVRIALAEKALDWQSTLMDLKTGEQSKPEFLRLNPEGVVPVLVDDEFVLRESSVIIDYLDQLSPENPLMPKDAKDQAKVRMWLIRCIDIHAAINTMSFASLFRARQLKSGTPEQIEANLSRLPNPQTAAKRLDIYRNGMASIYVAGALKTLENTLTDMNTALHQADWLVGSSFGLSDIALVAYIDRLDLLAFSGLWTNRHPHVADWLDRTRARPSYGAAVAGYIPQAELDEMQTAGEAAWPDLLSRL